MNLKNQENKNRGEKKTGVFSASVKNVERERKIRVYRKSKRVRNKRDAEKTIKKKNEELNTKVTDIEKSQSIANLN